MAKNLTAPNDGIGSAGNTAGATGIETSTTGTSRDHYAEATTQSYVPASPGSGVLSTPGVSSTQTDGLDEGN
jgi:hypothetical protein